MRWGGEDLLTQTIQAQLDGLDCRLVSCTKCHMECLLDVLDFGERGTAMVVTKWINFGAGLTPSDRDWQCRFSQPHRYTLQHWAVAVRTIQKCFEPQPGQSYDDLCRESVSGLFPRLGLGQKRLKVDGAVGLTLRSKYAGSPSWYLSPHAAEEAQGSWLASSFANLLTRLLSWFPGREAVCM